MSKTRNSGRLVLWFAMLSALPSAVACEQKTPAASKESAQESPTAAESPAAAASATQSPSPKDSARPGAEKPAAQVAKGGDATPEVALFPELKKTVELLLADFDSIPEDRKKQLKKLALFVETKQSAGEPAELIFICTHNSRRSHLSQLWAATAAAHYGIENVKTYSGGTEATAFNPRAVAAVERAGFVVENPGGENPHYQVKFSPEAPPQECFSKKYDDAANPKSGFAAVMTCTQADKNCPSVEGSALRVTLPFVDPKESDDTAKEVATYDERSRQIGTEMFYLFSLINKKS